MIVSQENWFLIIIAFIWIFGAVLQDLKRREVDNIWNFSLIGVALAYRLAYTGYSSNYWFFINGLIGLFIFILLGNIFYYTRLFAGGDAKLLIGLGPTLVLSSDWIINLKIFATFIFLFLVCGSIYVLIWALFLVIKNFNKFIKEFVKYWKINIKMVYTALALTIIWIIFVLIIKEYLLIIMSFIILLFPILFVFAKAVEESCMIKAMNPKEVTEGDWLYRDILIKGKKIKADWEGVSRRELNLIQDKLKRKVLIKQGIPFTPSFLFALIILLILSYGFYWF
jgi:hypothetical protein